VCVCEREREGERKKEISKNTFLNVSAGVLSFADTFF
jgi:hypothetical protein